GEDEAELAEHQQHELRAGDAEVLDERRHEAREEAELVLRAVAEEDIRAHALRQHAVERLADVQDGVVAHAAIGAGEYPDSDGEQQAERAGEPGVEAEPGGAGVHRGGFDWPGRRATLAPPGGAGRKRRGHVRRDARQWPWNAKRCRSTS